MQITWTIDKKNELVRLKYFGNPDFETWAGVMEDIFKHPDFKAGMGFMADLKKSGAPDSNHLRAVKNFLISHKEQMNGIRWANITTKRPVHYGMTRMAQVLVEEQPWELNAFYSEKEAMEWLCSAPKRVIHKG